jgi:group I intron endonuclease
MGEIYFITSPSGKSYIGKTIYTSEARWRQHLHDANGKCRSLISRAIRKYGSDSMMRGRLWSGPEERLNETEIWYIKNLGTKNPGGYNLADGGEGSSGHQWTEEQRKKSSDTHKVLQNLPEVRARNSAAVKLAYQNPEIRAKLLEAMRRPEVRQKMSEARKGRETSAETRANMGLAARGRKKSQEWKDKIRLSNLGQKRSPETREKIRLSRVGKKRSPEAIANFIKATTGQKRSPEARMRMSAAQNRPEVNAKRSATWAKKREVLYAIR